MLRPVRWKSSNGCFPVEGDMCLQLHQLFSAVRTFSFTKVNFFLFSFPLFCWSVIFIVFFLYICHSIHFFLFLSILFFIALVFIVIRGAVLEWFLGFSLELSPFPSFFWSVSLLLFKGFGLLALYHSIFKTSSCSCTSPSSTCLSIVGLRCLPRSSWCILLKADV